MLNNVVNMTVILPAAPSPGIWWPVIMRISHSAGMGSWQLRSPGVATMWSSLQFGSRVCIQRQIVWKCVSDQHNISHNSKVIREWSVVIKVSSVLLNPEIMTPTLKVLSKYNSLCHCIFSVDCMLHTDGVDCIEDISLVRQIWWVGESFGMKAIWFFFRSELVW